MKEYMHIFLYNEEASCTSYTSCVQVAILLLQDLRVKDIYAIYFRLSVQCPIMMQYIYDVMNMFDQVQ